MHWDEINWDRRIRITMQGLKARTDITVSEYESEADWDTIRACLESVRSLAEAAIGFVDKAKEQEGAS